jgi:hypothetical protein
MRPVFAARPFQEPVGQVGDSDGHIGQFVVRQHRQVVPFGVRPGQVLVRHQAQAHQQGADTVGAVVIDNQRPFQLRRLQFIVPDQRVADAVCCDCHSEFLLLLLGL